MKVNRIVLFAAVSFLFAALPVPAQTSPDSQEGDSPRWYSPSRYNPMKLIKRNSKTASEHLAADNDLEIKLTTQLQRLAVLPARTNLKDACSDFKDLTLCVAALRASHALKMDFRCLKWDVTGVKPKPVADACAGPAGGKAMRFDKAIDLLKPDADAKSEAKTALENARNDIKDASS